MRGYCGLLACNSNRIPPEKKFDTLELCPLLMCSDDPCTRARCLGVSKRVVHFNV